MRTAKIIFVTGTDTGVGKTVLTALLLHHLRTRGVRALAVKPFCSGGLADVRLLQSLQPSELSDREMNPYYFAKPLAPLVAATKSTKTIRLNEVVEGIRCVAKKCDVVLIEGSGGLMVPLGRGFTVVDLINRLRCTVVIAARNRLGTINHTLLTVSALQTYRIPLTKQVVVLMESGKSDLSSRTNPRILARLLRPCPVLRIPNLGKKVGSRNGISKGSRKCHSLLKQIARRWDRVRR